MLKRLLPVRFKDAVKVLCGSASAVSGPFFSCSDDRVCPVCRARTEFRPLPYEYVRKLVDHGCVHPLFDCETMNYDEYTCRLCTATDRDRLFAMYFERVWGDRGEILEIGPQPPLTKFLRALPGAAVRTADLFNSAADDKVDVTRMTNYPDARFDAWICSHVLEHVPDDQLAMRELRRVLKPGGWGIVLVPICRSVKTTLEDPTITDPALRWKYFGQDDHIRMYAKSDLVGRLTGAGFDVSQVIADEFFGTEACRTAGVDPASVLYIARNPLSLPATGVSSSSIR